jgi:hypothetical protein
MKKIKSTSAIYYETRQFKTSKKIKKNLIYHVYFGQVPSEAGDFHLNFRKNVGLFIIVTLNTANQSLALYHRTYFRLLPDICAHPLHG